MSAPFPVMPVVHEVTIARSYSSVIKSKMLIWILQLNLCHVNHFLFDDCEVFMPNIKFVRKNGISMQFRWSLVGLSHLFLEQPSALEYSPQYLKFVSHFGNIAPFSYIGKFWTVMCTQWAFIFYVVIRKLIRFQCGTGTRVNHQSFEEYYIQMSLQCF